MTVGALAFPEPTLPAIVVARWEEVGFAADPAVRVLTRDHVRKGFTLMCLNGGNDIYIGNDSSVNTDGFKLEPGQSIPIDHSGEVWLYSEGAGLWQIIATNR